MTRADDRTGLGSTAAALEQLADELPGKLRAFAAELRSGPDEPPRADAASWGADVQERIEALSASTSRVLEAAADEVDAWAHEHTEEDSQHFARQL